MTEIKQKVFDYTNDNVNESKKTLEAQCTNLTFEPIDKKSEGFSLLSTLDTKSDISNYKKGADPVGISFDKNISNMTTEKALASKSVLSQSDMKVFEIVSKVKDDMFKCVIESFDRMLLHSQKLREENERYVKEKLLPQKQILNKEIEKTIIKNETLKNIQ